MPETKKGRSVAVKIPFYGAPNENHEVEIGYGLNPIFQGKGYMTEVVKALCSWALKQSIVKKILSHGGNIPQQIGQCVMDNAFLIR